MSRSVRFLLAVSSGVLLALPWLGFPGWLLFVAFLPIMAIDDFLVRNHHQYRSVVFAGYSFVTFAIWNLVTTWWILHATMAGAVVAVFLNSFFMTMVFWTIHVFRRAKAGPWGYLAYIVFWISFEYLHYHWDIEWPWLTLGNGFSNNVRMIQWYEFTGVFGGSLWIMLLNLLIFNLLKVIALRKQIREVVIAGIWSLLLIALPVALSLYRYFNYTEVQDPRKVLIVQPNIDPYSETHDNGAVNQKLSRFIELVKRFKSDDLDYIVGPETVFEENWNEAYLGAYPAFTALQDLTLGKKNTQLVIGASTYRIYTGDDKVSSTARRSHDGMIYDVYNSAIMTGYSGSYQVYHKSVLVAGVEKMPYRKYLKFLDSLIINLGGTTGNLGIQNEPSTFDSPSGDKIAPAICYESVFGEYMTRFIRKGAEAVFVITNDGWWKNTPGYRQHFSFARLRAVETRRAIVRAANTGISAFIDQKGEIIIRSEWWTEDALTANINLNKKITFYVRYGDYIARISIFITAILLVNLLLFRFRLGKKKPH